ncbi:hypothetical protein [Streptomyces yaizuensis]|uniref:Uncharacterized protein n=1 Tax=Streptomyces yaizuensis TaxID=2989713 RepID=A0ABQ5P1N4_9ACTN|nr:hypothetical protein [Streptomyces sp. YSPA8]GLF96522.1 hypothetical protein SYYSPA8_19515 [Streptomyces sp. YSPA8]
MGRGPAGYATVIRSAPAWTSGAEVGDGSCDVSLGVGVGVSFGGSDVGGTGVAGVGVAGGTVPPPPFVGSGTVPGGRGRVGI